MAKEFPGTDLKASPHINSKLQTWKKNYGSLCAITARSGIGFNVNGNHQIDCNDDQWEQIVKCDANAKTMRHKSWPMFEDWKEIIGKDRATGEGAQDFMDSINVAMHGDNLAGDGNLEGDYYQPNLDDIYVDDVGENSTCHSEKHEAVNKSSNKGKKRKAADPVEGLTDLFLSIGRSTNERLDKIASRIGYEYDLDKEKKDVYELVKDIPGLTLDQKFDVCEIFVDKHDRLLIFKGLPDDAKAQYVQRLLKPKPT